MLYLALIVISAFTEEPVFIEPIAHPRSPESSISIQSAKYLGHRIEYIDAAIGRNLAIATFGDRFKRQIILQGGTWLSLGYKDGAFPLLTQDFYFSLGSSFRWSTISGAIKFNHISAHLGDGIDDLIYETLTKEEKAEYNEAEDHTGRDILLLAPKAYSRDYLSAQLAWNPPRPNRLNDLRLYIQAGYAHKMIPNELGRWYLGVGTELTYPSKSFDYFAAQDVTWNQDVDSIDYSLRTGIVMNGNESLFTTQIALTIYSGSDRRGQLVGRQLTAVGLGVFIQ
jgi:hypothetical protein